LKILFDPVVDLMLLERDVLKKIAAAVNHIIEHRPHVLKRTTSLVDADLSASHSYLLGRGGSSAKANARIFDLAFSSRHSEVILYLLGQNGDSPFIVGSDEKVFLSPFQAEAASIASYSHLALSVVLNSACVWNACCALEALTTTYSTWCGNTQQGLADPEDSAPTRSYVEWSQVLNKQTLCAGLANRAVTPLQAAVDCDSADCVFFLLGIAGISAPSALFVRAVRGGRCSQITMLMLLRHLAPDTKSAFNLGLEFSDLSTFLSCMDHQDQPGETVLHLCCRRGYPLLVQHLLALGADPLLPDARGNTSLEYSIAAGHKQVTQLMYPYCSPKIQRAVAVLVYMARKLLLRRKWIRT
jgi:hypothetical protein